METQKYILTLEQFKNNELLESLEDLESLNEGQEIQPDKIKKEIKKGDNIRITTNDVTSKSKNPAVLQGEVAEISKSSYGKDNYSVTLVISYKRGGGKNMSFFKVGGRISTTIGKYNQTIEKIEAGEMPGKMKKLKIAWPATGAINDVLDSKALMVLHDNMKKLKKLGGKVHASTGSRGSKSKTPDFQFSTPDKEFAMLKFHKKGFWMVKSVSKGSTWIVDQPITDEELRQKLVQVFAKY